MTQDRIANVINGPVTRIALPAIPRQRYALRFYHDRKFVRCADVFAAEQLEYSSLSDSGSASTYMMKGVPATYIISRRGNTVMRRIGSQRWDSPDVKQFIDAQLDAAP